MIQYRSMTTAFSSPCSSDLQHQLMSYNEKDGYLVTTVGGDSSPSSTRSSSLSPRAPEEDLEGVEGPIVGDDAQSEQQQQQQQVKQWSYEEQFRQVIKRILDIGILLCYCLHTNLLDLVNCLFFSSCTICLLNQRERNFLISYSTTCKRKVTWFTMSFRLYICDMVIL